MKKALITGITGQDGSYLAELLLEKGYEVHGIVRRQATGKQNFLNINSILDKLHLHEGDLIDEVFLFNIVKKIKPDEIYNLGAQSHVGASSNMPLFTTKVNTLPVITLLEAIKEYCPECRFYQASSSEMFGNSVDKDNFQRETTPMNPVSPYACSKLFSYHIVRHYRKAHNIFASNGILFNHESPRRGEEFVTRKIIRGAKAIIEGKAKKLYLGNLDSYRDWSHAKDMVRGMWMILNHKAPNDFILASGETHSVREFCDIVFYKLNLGDYENYVEVNAKFLRPQELVFLRGDASKAHVDLGWEPEYNFEELVEDMIKNG